jgi:predicted amidohydrolase YtcJ
VPDLVLRDGVVWTGVEGRETAEAVAISEGRIVAVGSNSTIDPLSDDSTRVVQLAGRAVTPGFIDAHTHFVSGGFQLSSIDLRDADTPEEFADRIESFAAGAPPGTWITGGGWDHELWGGELPQRRWIDARTPDHPVFVQRLDIHMALANRVALQAAGVTSATEDPPGGSIVRDEHGEPTGILKDEAMDLVLRVMPTRTERQLDEALDAAAHHALSLGVTQIHDMGSWANLATYQRAQTQGRLPLRVYSVVPMRDWERMRDYVAEHGVGGDRLWWGAVKAFVDGSLGSTTAWFHEPYSDAPDSTGLVVTDPSDLSRWILGADAAGLHVIVHAIGDRANDWLLDTYAGVATTNGDRDRRFRIEHAQHLTADAISRFAEQGVIASMQPFHAADDGRWAEKRVGAERIRTTYPFRSLLDAGATLAFGSDWTVAPLDPIVGIDAAVSRRTLDGMHPEGWIPEQRIPLEDTLRAYTSGAARSGFMEDRVGTVENGKLADLVVLSRDVFAMDPHDLGDVRVDITIVDGQVAYERPSARE